MNKKNISFLSMAAALTVAGLSGCSEEQTLPVGEGTMYLSTRVNSDVVVESRATLEEELGASTVVWIYSDQGVVRKYNGIDAVPTSGIKLISGTYTVKAWAGTAEYASFDNRWFEGSEVVEIAPDQPKAVEVVCKIANVVASVKYPENVDELISDYTLTVSHKGGSLTFNGEEEYKNGRNGKGYYMMPEGVTALDYVLTFTTDGQEKTVRGTIDDVEPAHEYVFNVKADNGNSEADNGAAFITIEVDDTTIDVESSVLITVPPAITGYGFDLSAPVAGESGSIGRKSVYVSATSALKSVALTGITGIEGFAEVDLVRASEDVLTSLASKGISREVQNVEGGQMIKIIFEDAYLNTLANREEAYIINISATDSNDKTTTAALTLRITEAPVVTAPVAEENISYATATLTGSVAKDGVERVGFEYALANTEDWTYVEGAASRAGYNKGQTYYATVSGLEVGTEYKYRAVSGTATEITFRADEETFTTVAGPQLPNAGMEGWYMEGKVNIPMASGTEEGWDSGNHGSSTMSKTLTQQNASMKHSGRYGAELKSQFVGAGIIGRFAAGNLFYGKYLRTDNVDGVIGFGRSFNFPDELKMTKLRLWVKYVPKPANSKGDGSHVPVGTNDTGHIFVALFDGPDTDAENTDGKYGFIVRTKDASRLFDKHASNVVAYGEHVFTEATAGDGLVMLEIPLEYYAGKGAPTHIAIVCTASKYGDYFEGGEGSTMYVDDFELVYKAL